MIVVNSTSEIDVVVAPAEFSLSSAYPNPFNPVTTMNLAIPAEVFASIKVYDILGRDIATLVESDLEARTYTFSWDAGSASSGVYFIRAIAGDNVQVQKVLLLK